MSSMTDELVDGGWVRVGPYSPFWKAPDDTGPVGRKWNERAAHTEMMSRRSVQKTPRAKTSSGTGAKRGPGRPRKTDTAEKTD